MCKQCAKFAGKQRVFVIIARHVILSPVGVAQSAKRFLVTANNSN
jgi:hypothetical protein